MLDALCVKEENLATDPETMTRALLQGQKDLSRLTWTGECQNLRDRVRFLRSLDRAPGPTCPTKRSLKTSINGSGPSQPGHDPVQISAKSICCRRSKRCWAGKKLRELDRLAPEFMTVPTGAKRKIDYSPESGPVLPVKLQEMFGCATTPTLADGRHPLVLHLLSPAGRPLQVTRDLPSFWKKRLPPRPRRNARPLPPNIPGLKTRPQPCPPPKPRRP